MKRKRFTEEQIIGILNEAEQAGNIREVCKLNNITEQTWQALRNASSPKVVIRHDVHTRSPLWDWMRSVRLANQPSHAPRPPSSAVEHKDMQSESDPA